MRSKLIVTLAVLAACQTGPAGIEDVVTGTLYWTGSVGGIGGWQHTPESTGYTVRLELDDDGTVSAFRNDSLIATSHISMTAIPDSSTRAEYDVTFDPPLPAFTFGSMDEATVRSPEPGTIVFQAPCCDRYNHTFTTEP